MSMEDELCKRGVLLENSRYSVTITGEEEEGVIFDGQACNIRSLLKGLCLVPVVCGVLART
jgi:hypothetical protein